MRCGGGSSGRAEPAVRLLTTPLLTRADDARNLVQQLIFIYLASYLLVGGLGLLVVPELTLRLLLSNGSYGDVMPRLVGVFMLALGGAVLEFVRARDYRYYRYAIIARIFIVVALTALYFKAGDPLFLVLDAIYCDTHHFWSMHPGGDLPAQGRNRASERGASSMSQFPWQGILSRAKDARDYRGSHSSKRLPSGSLAQPKRP